MSFEQCFNLFKALLWYEQMDKLLEMQRFQNDKGKLYDQFEDLVKKAVKQKE